MFEDKNRLYGIIGTISFHVIMFLIFIFCGFTTPLPLPEEQGVEVNLGNSEEGMGAIQPEQLTENVATPVPNQTTGNQEEVATQSSEESLNINKKKTEKTNKTETKPTEEKETEKVNTLALFPGKKTGKNGGNEGNTGKPGDQGNKFGDPNATNHTGNPGSGGGPSFSLNGRSAKSLPIPDYTSKEQGTVVVKIWVNNKGEVSRAEAGQRGTTTSDRALWKLAENAAMRAKFSPDNDAPEDQTGTITYKFIRLN
ncbi:MAG: energy transducer TonB family protein [Ferruginibacter sp.]